MKTTKVILISVLTLSLMSLLLWYFLSEKNLKTTRPVVNDNEEQYTIVAFGDSLTAGYGLPLNESYPNQLEEILNNRGFDLKIINAGVSGETTKGNNERASFIRDQNPDMIIWGIGGNDALRALPVSELRNNMESTIKILQSGENAPKLLILKMQSPLNAGPNYKKEFDAVYKELSDKYKLPLVPFMTLSVFLNGDLMLQDRIHPNREGYKRLIEGSLLDAVLKEIE